MQHTLGEIELAKSRLKRNQEEYEDTGHESYLNLIKIYTADLEKLNKEYIDLLVRN